MASGSLFGMGFSVLACRLETIDGARDVAGQAWGSVRRRPGTEYSKSLKRLRKLPIDGVR